MLLERCVITAHERVRGAEGIRGLMKEKSDEVRHECERRIEPHPPEPAHRPPQELERLLKAPLISPQRRPYATVL